MGFLLFSTVRFRPKTKTHARTLTHTLHICETRLQPKIQDIKITIYELSTCHS